MSTMETRCYAIRRLSPFQGFTQIIEAGGGQASSNNGIDWRIQVHIQTSHSPEDSLDGSQADQQLILFGFWSSEGGFHRVPLPPMVSSREIEVAAQPIIDELLSTTRSVPFKHIDICELWLLDEKDNSPLVLIATNGNPEQLPTVRRPEWQSTALTDDSFTRTWSKDKNTPQHTARDELNALIMKTAGLNPAAQWFLRGEDGSGKAIDGVNINDNLTGRQLSKDDFPELLLKENWPEENSQQLVNAYFEWQAPFLLTLPHLNSIKRKRLEQLAFKQVFKVEGQYKLWPEIIDKEKLKAVLIEAQMRRSNPEAGEQTS